MPYGGETPTEVMRKHVDPNVAIVPPDHLNTKLSGGLGMVVETMMAKNREHRYQTPDDLILDLKCLHARREPDDRRPEARDPARPGRGRSRRASIHGAAASEEEMVEMASYVNNRNIIIATMAMLLVVSVITNVILFVVH